MKKRLVVAMLLCLVVGAQVFSDAGFPDADGAVLSDYELESYTGKLHIFGVEILPRLSRFIRKRRASRPARVHCDIVAQNRAESLGLNTNDQAGNSRDYNTITVNEIYAGYPNGRSSTPVAGSSGYYFTSYGEGKQHMGAYTRQADSSTYTRYMNRSYEGTERAATVNTDYSPQGVTSQRFVALPRRSSDEIFYR